MGLSSFNRMRREKASVAKIEAERFKRDNAARNKSRADKEAARKANRKLKAKSNAEEVAASERIGEKFLAGQEDGHDLPLRKDHAAEIAGRNMADVQSPKDPVALVDERIPPAETKNEVLVEHTPVDGPGPTPEMVDAAFREAGVRGGGEGGNDADEDAPGGDEADGEAEGTGTEDEGEAADDDDANGSGGDGGEDHEGAGAAAGAGTAPDGAELTVEKGPGGRFFVMRGKDRVSEGFKTQAGATKAKNRMAAAE